MFAKRLLRKGKSVAHSQIDKNDDASAASDVDFHVAVHYGIPSTASILAFDPIQSLLAIGTLDGRIKVIGGDNIEGLLVSPKQLPYKYVEFLQNQGFLVSISNGDDIQVWNLESRSIVSGLQWESSITSFSVIYASYYMYIGDEYGMISVLKYDAEAEELLQLPYRLSADYLKDAAGISVSLDQPIVSILPQPCSSGKRVLVAYASGLFIILDVVEARVLVMKGDKALQLKDKVVDSSVDEHNGLAEGYEEEMEEKEITTVCWASSSGSILSVGYIDGDILFWRTVNESGSKGKHSGSSFNDVVKLQLSCAEKRLPVVVLHWSANNKSNNDGDGQLFIYGGCEIGSGEVITVLNLEWSSRFETLRCTGRVDLNLRSSYADMILTPCAGKKGNKNSNSLFVLTNPGKLQFVDDTKLSSAISQQVKKISVTIIDFPAVVPTTDPHITVAKLSMLPSGGTLSKYLSKLALQMNSEAPGLDGAVRWPLTGGITNRSQFVEDSMVRLVYSAGYEDGSVRIWDATCPDLSLICVLENKEKGINLAGSNASVLKVDFCCHTSHLAVGNECGLVYICNLSGNFDDTSFHFIAETKHEVHILSEEKKHRYQAVLSLVNSPVQALQFMSWGTKLSVGFECGRIALFDMNSLSLLFLTDPVSASSSLVISILGKEFMPLKSQSHTPKSAGSKIPNEQVGDFIFVLTKDAKIYVVNGSTGTMINSHPMHLKKESTAISMYVIESNATVFGSEKVSHQEILSGTDQLEIEGHSSEISRSRGNLNDSLTLLCCKDELRLYRTKSVIQGESKSVLKVPLENPCCWTTTYKNHEKVCGLVLLYQTGDLEIRSLNDLEVVKRGSLMSTLRWNFKADMEKAMSSTESGLIALAYGQELAFISLLSSKNDFGIPEYFPSLHDKVLAAAAEAAISFSANQKKKQGTTPGILRVLVKGVKWGQGKNVANSFHALKSHYSHLEGVFSRNPSATTSTDNQAVMGLDIDDIEIDQPVPSPSTSSSKPHPNQREKDSEREKLFNGASTSDMKPRQRTLAEIMATYRKAGDVSSAAGIAKSKLMERQEKLERISRKTQDLRNGAEDFASLANELVKAMENRKWWQI